MPEQTRQERKERKIQEQSHSRCGGGGWHLEGGDGGGGQRVLGARARHGESARSSPSFSSSKKPRMQKIQLTAASANGTGRGRLNGHRETRIRATNSRWVDGRHHCRGVELEGWNGNDKGVWVVREGFYVYGAREGVRGGWRRTTSVEVR